MQNGAIKDWTRPGETLTFGEIRMKPMQIAILNCNRRHDVLVNLPTGFGKSLLFQYPASKLKDQCVVIFVPLKALLWDCLKEAELHKLTAVQCDHTFIQKYQTHGFLPQMLFLTPERLFMNQTVRSFLECLNQEKKIEMFVIDEVHCISEWGSDFRPDYAKLCEIKSIFPGPRILGMSATIPQEARKDLTSKLQIWGGYFFQSSSNRPNLIYQVMAVQKSKIAGSIIDYVKMKKLKEESGIIYCQTIKNAEEVFKQLKKYQYSCCLFHSKLPERKRQKHFDSFMSGEVKCIVATICFGMGVNKKNIRYVINVGVSLSAENYYQESGRAGRDGELSFCLLMTYNSDVNPLQYLINQSTSSKVLARRRLYKLQQIKVYAKSCECRKRALFKIFGQDFSVEQCRKTCDFCINDMGKDTSYQEVDYSDKGFKIIEMMQHYKQKITKMQLIGHLKGRDLIKNKITKDKYRDMLGLLKQEKNENVEHLVQAMISRGLLVSFAERIKWKGKSRVIEYFKPCTKTELSNQRRGGLKVMIMKTKQLPKLDKEHIANPYVTQKFQKYVMNKKKVLPAPEFQANFDKTEPKIQVTVQDDDDEMKEIKMVEMGPDVEKFLDQIFPEYGDLSKGNTSQEDIGDLDEEQLMKLDNLDTSKEEFPESFEEIFIPPSKQPIPQPPNLPLSQKQLDQNLESDQEDSLFQMIQQKRSELRQKKQQQQKKAGQAVKRVNSLPLRHDFL